MTSGGQDQVGGSRYSADIRWTTHGVAHIRADDWGSLGFGQGYACARDNLGIIADMVVKVRSERARFHGPGPEGAHVASDFGYLALGLQARAEALRDAQEPLVRDLIAGYVAGCNAWLAEGRQDGALPAWCADAAWLRPFEELDLYRYLVDATLLASGRNLVGLLGRAESPGPDGPVAAAPLSALGGSSGAASNGWAFGRDGTAGGGGVVMGNPHFPWHGEARFWECHLTIPGELDVYGACLLGVPGVQIGFTQRVGWTHTFSAGCRFTLYKLDLVAGTPTRYRFGTDEREMTAADHSVDVLGEDGTTQPVTRTLWSSHHGPMVNLPLLGWGLETAFTYRDANLDNTAMIEQFVHMNRARDLDEFQAAFARSDGMPWANTLAADDTGRAWYIDASATPNLTAAAQQRFRDRLVDDPIAALLFENRVPLLDGSEPDDTWVEEPGARSPGLVPFDRLPQLERADVIINANDSHWLTNPAEPLEGYSVLHGFERTPRTPRTRQNVRQAQLLADAGATIDNTLDTLLSSASLTAELLRDAVVARIRARGTITIGDVTHDLSDAAAVLAAWDGTCTLDAVGAPLWREVMAGFSAAELRDAGALFAAPFDPDDPVATPHGLAEATSDAPDPVAVAVARACAALAEAGVALHAPLGAVQWAPRGDVRVPVPGGGEVEGVANVLAPSGALPSQSLAPVPPLPEAQPGRTERTGLRAGGYPVTYGVSFLMAVALGPDGPHGRGLLAYGQSDEPDAPSHLAATEAYAAGALRPLLFADADIESDANLVRRTITG